MQKSKVKILILAVSLITLIIGIFGLMWHYKSENCYNAEEQISSLQKVIDAQTITNCSQYLETPQAELNDQYFKQARKELISKECLKSLNNLKKIDMKNSCIKIDIPNKTRPDKYLWITLIIFSTLTFFILSKENKNI